MSEGRPRITIPLPRIPGTLLGVLVTLAVVGGFMAIDRTVVHWYVPDLDPVSQRLEDVRSDGRGLRSRVGSIESSVSRLETSVRNIEESPADLSLFESDLERDLTIHRLGFALTINSLVNNLGGFQSTGSPRGEACMSWLLDSEGSMTDCGFTPTE